jgi:hypothetical protein
MSVDTINLRGIAPRIKQHFLLVTSRRVSDLQQQSPGKTYGHYTNARASLGSPALR